MAEVKKKNEINVEEALSQSEAFIVKYKTAIIACVAAVIVVVAGVMLYRNYVSEPRAKEAAAALFKGEEYFGMNEYETALNGDSLGYAGFIKIADEYSSTPSGKLAKAYAGISYAQLGKYEDAVRYLSGFDGDDLMVGPAAIGTLGDCYANLNQLDKATAAFMEAVAYLKQFRLVDCEYFINNELNDKSILAEGAQGSMLDIDYGSYPFVTSSSTACAGACIGLGVAPSRIGHVYGIFKAYCTRVGSGPFPTELFDETGDRLREIGHEFGAVTGRPRRTGWLDLVALKYAVMLSGVTDLIMMKSDCLDSFGTIKVCTSYKVDGHETDQVPFDTYAHIEPVYTEFKGWNTDLTGCRKESELPVEFKDYVKFMETYLGVPIKIISLGPDRDATIMR